MQSALGQTHPKVTVSCLQNALKIPILFDKTTAAYVWFSEHDKGRYDFQERKTLPVRVEKVLKPHKEYAHISMHCASVIAIKMQWITRK